MNVWVSKMVKPNCVTKYLYKYYLHGNYVQLAPMQKVLVYQIFYYLWHQRWNSDLRRFDCRK